MAAHFAPDRDVVSATYGQGDQMPWQPSQLAAEAMTCTAVREHAHRPSCSRVHHSVVCHRGSLWVYGGVEGSSQGGHGYSTWKFGVEKETWGLVMDQGGGKRFRREGHTAVVWGNGMYVFGGHKGMTFAQEFAVLNFDTLRWAKVHVTECSAVPVPRFGHAALVAQGRMWVAGGFLREPTTSLLAAFSFSSHTWEHYAMPPGVSCSVQTTPAMGYLDGKLYIQGLYRDPHDSTKLAVFDVETEVWECVEPEGLPSDALFCAFGLVYASPCFCPKTKKLYLFSTEKQFRRRQNASSHDQRAEVVLPILYSLCLEAATLRWARVSLSGASLPSVHSTTEYDAKFKVCPVDGSLYLCGGLHDEHSLFLLAPLARGGGGGAAAAADVPLVGLRVPAAPSHAARSSASTARRSTKSSRFGKGSIAGPGGGGGGGGGRRRGDEPLLVPFVKDTPLHPSTLFDLTTPVVRLTTADMMRGWQEGTYASARRWLTEHWEGLREAERKRREESNKFGALMAEAAALSSAAVTSGAAAGGSSLQGDAASAQLTPLLLQPAPPAAPVSPPGVLQPTPRQRTHGGSATSLLASTSQAGESDGHLDGSLPPTGSALSAAAAYHAETLRSVSLGGVSSSSGVMLSDEDVLGIRMGAAPLVGGARLVDLAAAARAREEQAAPARKRWGKLRMRMMVSKVFFQSGFLDDDSGSDSDGGGGGGGGGGGVALLASPKANAPRVRGAPLDVSLDTGYAPAPGGGYRTWGSQHVRDLKALGYLRQLNASQVLREVRERARAAVEGVGCIPDPPPPAELRHCVQASHSFADPHYGRGDEGGEDGGGGDRNGGGGGGGGSVGESGGDGGGSASKTALLPSGPRPPPLRLSGAKE